MTGPDTPEQAPVEADRPDGAPAPASPWPPSPGSAPVPHEEPQTGAPAQAEPEQQPDQQVPVEQLPRHEPAVPPTGAAAPVSTWPLPPLPTTAVPADEPAGHVAPLQERPSAVPAEAPPIAGPLVPAETPATAGPVAAPVAEEPHVPAEQPTAGSSPSPDETPVAVPDAPPDPPSLPPAVRQADAERTEAGPARGVLVPVLAALVVVLLGLTGYLGWKAADTAGPPAVETSRTQALASARDAARAVFSYDYRRLTKDFAAGKAVTTGTFADQYSGTTAKLLDFAVKNKATVAADVSDASVVRASEDEVVCLVFLNQTSSSSAVATPRITQSRLEMTMKRRGGRWLVASINAL